MPEAREKTRISVFVASSELRLRIERMVENYSSEGFRFGARFAPGDNASTE
jgi:hypothetical protein